MGGPVFGFGGGRKDVYEPERDIYWGAEDQWVNEGVQTRIDPEKQMDLENPLAAIQMGLIYVNPEGPGGNPDRSEEHTSELQSLMRISYAVICLKTKPTPKPIQI